MMDDGLLMLMFGFRLVERLILTFVVLGTAVVLMAAFRKSVERIRFQTEEKVNLSADIVMATPIFALLVVVAYAYVSYRHPVTFDVQATASLVSAEGTNGAQTGAEQVAQSDPRTVTSMSLSGLAPDKARPADVEKARGDALGRVKALNCLLDEAPDVDPRMQDAAVAAKVALLTDPLVWNRSAWGSPAILRLWALGIGDPPPAELVQAFEGRHTPCVQE